MSTEDKGKVLPDTVRVLTLWALNFTTPKSDDVAERKGNFTLKTRWLSRDADGNTSEGGNKTLSVAETKKMMASTITLEDGTVLSGAQIAEAVGLSTDDNWRGDYDIVPEPIEEVEEEII